MSRSALFPFVRRRTRGPGLVLMYHSIADVASDPWALHVQPDRFAEHVEVIARRFAPTPLRQIRDAPRGLRSRPPVAVTFDDGYANNLHHAAPHLERYGVPATVFVVSGFVGREDECWWDALERALLDPEVRHPAEIRVPVGGREQRWSLAENVEGSDEEVPRTHEWRAWEEPTRLEQQAYRQLWERLLLLDEEARRLAIQSVCKQTGDERTARATHRLLSPAELLGLGRKSTIEIGAHTVTHPMLTSLPPDRQHEEICGSKRQLEDWLDRPVESFAYPYGKAEHFTAGTVASVRVSGFAYSCTGDPARVTAGTDPFRLPRFHVGNWDGDVFEERLRNWLTR